jgi:hypothetical protein
MQTSHHEERDALNWLDRTSPPTSPALEPERSKDSPAPVQDDLLKNEFFEAYKEYKAYTSLSGPDLRKVEVEKGYYKGLNRELRSWFAHKKSLDPFKRLSEILVKLKISLYLKLQILFG